MVFFQSCRQNRAAKAPCCRGSSSSGGQSSAWGLWVPQVFFGSFYFLGFGICLGDNAAVLCLCWCFCGCLVGQEEVKGSDVRDVLPSLSGITCIPLAGSGEVPACPALRGLAAWVG